MRTMNIPVSIRDKQDFLQWFLTNHPTEAHDVNWFLNDLLDDEQALFYVHFVQDIQYCPKGIILRASEQDEITFTFYKGNVQTNNVYTAYHERQLYRDEALFIQIDFPGKHNNKLYRAVLEDEISFKQEIRVMTEQILTHSLQEGKKKYIEEEINRALETRDYERFIHYSAQLKKLKS